MMKRFLLPLFLILTFLTPGLSPLLPTSHSYADGYPEDLRPRRRARQAKVEEPPEPPPPPSCVSTSREPKVRIVSLNPKQKIDKIMGAITECVTTQWDVMALLAGPNIIGISYPDEKERWGYLWMWSYDLKNPLGDTLILMDNPGKRITKGKNPVELYITYNENDIVERVEMYLVKKKHSQY